jgi:hypothetical protein
MLAGCETLTGVSEPEELHVIVDSDDVATVTVITSRYFLQIPDPECPDTCEPTIQLVTSDTAQQSVRYEQRFRFDSRQQYYVETYPAVEQVATLSMRIDIDGDVWYDDFRQLEVVGQDGKRESLRFVYQFREARVPGT